MEKSIPRNPLQNIYSPFTDTADRRKIVLSIIKYHRVKGKNGKGNSFNSMRNDWKKKWKWSARKKKRKFFALVENVPVYKILCV